MKKKYTRRQLIRTGTATAGVAMAAGLTGQKLMAQAAPVDTPTLVLLFLRGGYNALFSAANAYVPNGAFGTSANSIRDLGNGLVVDRTFDAFSDFAKAHMASVGIQHGSNNHGNSKRLLLRPEGEWRLLRLAAEMGGDGVIKFAGINLDGDQVDTNAAAINGVSPQIIRDFENTANVLGAGTDPALILKARIQQQGILAAQGISGAHLTMNSSSLITAQNGYQTGAAILEKQATAEPIDVDMIRAAYGVRGNNISGNNMAMQMAAAEMMVRANANVVQCSQGGWDSHGDTDGNRVRNQMQDNMQALSTFVDRMVDQPGRNVVLAIIGDFNRTIGNSGHGRGLAATVIGKGVQQGTTVQMNDRSALVGGTPGPDGFWGYLGHLLGAPDSFRSRFANPHKSLIKL